MIITPLPVHHHDTPVCQTTTAPIHLLVIPFQQTSENIEHGRPYRIRQLAGLRDTIVRYLQIKAIKTETVLMQPAHGSIRLPCAAMKGLSHFQQFHAAVRAHHRLLPISPVRFQVDVSIRTIIARNGQKLPFQESQPPAAVYDDLRLSVIVHHPVRPSSKQTAARSAQVSNTSLYRGITVTLFLRLSPHNPLHRSWKAFRTESAFRPSS